MSDEKNEIVIIRRGGHGAHEEHHGGVWKIAFADFMTAMMAFFLVMWLVSANDKTRTTIARYFNPVKLVDATIRPQGLHDPKTTDGTIKDAPDTNAPKGTSKEEGGHRQPEGAFPNETPQGREARLDAKLRTNPFVALAEIAGEQGASDTPPKEAPHGTAPVIGRKGGTAFRDPFAPPPPQAIGDAPDKDDEILAITPPRPVVPAAEAPARSAEPPKPDAAATDRKAKDVALTQQIAETVKAPGSAGGPDVAVRRTSEGFLVSLTDTSNFSMFTNGSAVPSKKVVQLMERVGKVLAAKQGGVVIRGYTDNKPFRSGRYDNWNLSIDRAQAAHYMLVRGGLKETRIAGVEGFADRATSPGVDPASPLNRRIEILLKDDAK